MIHHPIGRSTDMIGHNIRPGMVPGGFMPGFFISETAAGKRRGRPRKYREISEAANVFLEGRQMPRAEEKAMAEQASTQEAQPL